MNGTSIYRMVILNEELIASVGYFYEFAIFNWKTKIILK